jgi:hypothetical protein
MDFHHSKSIGVIKWVYDLGHIKQFSMFKFIHEKLCTDHKYYCLKDIKSNNQQIMNYRMDYINKVKDGYGCIF